MAFDRISLRIVWQALAAVLVYAAARILYNGYARRARIRALRAQGIPVLPHSMIWGHLPIFNDFVKEHPPDVNIYVFHTWIRERSKKYFPNLESLPPVLYLDLWPLYSFATVFDPIMAGQFTIVNNLPKGGVTAEFLDPLTAGMDIVSNDGEAWKTWRSRFNPGFSQRSLTALLPDLIEEALVFVDGLKKLAGSNGQWGPVFQLEETTTNLTFDVITRAALDLRLHEQTRTSSSPVKLALLDQIRLMGMLANAARLIPIGRMPWHNIAIIRNNRVMRDALMPQINKKLQSEGNDSQKKTVVDLAIKYVEKDSPNASRQKPDSEFIERLIANLKVFLFAGHDTTSSTICFMVKLLRDHPDCLAQVQREHDQVFGADPLKAMEVLKESPHLLYSLPYTLGVIKETLRLYPLAATIRHGPPGYFLEDPKSSTKYPMEGYLIWLSVPGVQRHPDYWPRPNEFAPERWTVPEGDPLHPFKDAWAPFSLGPRNCIGMELALTELKLVSILICRTFEIEEAWEEWDKKQGSMATPSHVVNGNRLYEVGGGTVHPKDGMPVHARLREHTSSL